MEEKDWNRVWSLWGQWITVHVTTTMNLDSPHRSMSLSHSNSQRRRGQWWALDNEEEEEGRGGVMHLPWPVILLTILPFHPHHWETSMPTTSTSSLQQDTSLFTFLPIAPALPLIAVLSLRFYSFFPPLFFVYTLAFY